ncbi:MAG: L-threonylcarbamoyladenylate synthase [Flavobacteriales bacterium]
MNLNEQISESINALRSGGVILCPSDTIASLSCDAARPDAIERIFEIKARPSEKRMIILVSSVTMLEGYVQDIPDSAYQLIDLSDDPLTIVYPSAKMLPEICRAEDGSVGIRVAKDGFIKTLIERFRKPIISTSANISGQDAPLKVSDVVSEVKKQVDLVVDLEEYREKPSSIVKFNSDGSFKIIRK